MDKVDAYDKEQLQAMGWLFDEIETPDTAVRFVEQDLTSEQQMQVFKNLGWDVYVTDSKSFLGSTLTPEEIERLKTTSAIILTDLNKIFLYGIQSRDYIRFYGMVNNIQFGGISINPSTGYVSGVGSYRFLDAESVHFTKQTLTIPQQNQALGNIGIDFVRLPYSLLGTTLSDEMMEVVDNARGIILVDTPNDFTLPTIYNKGCTTSTGAIFITIGETQDVYYISYNKDTKTLSNVVHNHIDTGAGADTDCVKYVEQTLTTAQQNTALSNIGLDYVIITMSGGSATLTEEQETALLASKGVILTGTASGQYWKNRVFVRDPDLNTFYSVLNNTMMVYCTYNSNTKEFKYQGVIKYTDTNAVSFNTKQYLTTGQQAQARNNIGVQSAVELLADDDFITQLKTKLGL